MRFGNASGPVTIIAQGEIAWHVSPFVTRPTLFDYYKDENEREAGSYRVLSMLRDGTLNVAVSRRFGLDEAVVAHRELEARRTSGSIVLKP